MAFGAVEAALDHGLNVPDDLSVIGLDDIMLGAHVRPPLTTIAIPKQELARQAIELLLRSEEHTSELQSPDHLVCRLLLEKKKKQQKPKHDSINRVIVSHTDDV